jgi:alkylation response protein AidB-like acyl-CoA dehydrogenase
VNFEFDAEQETFRRSLRRFLSERSPSAAVREAMVSEAGYQPELWAQMSNQLGLPGLLVPEDHGGSGASLLEAAIVMEETGRALACSPFFATTALGVLPLLLAGTPAQQAELLPAIAVGSVTATTAITEPGAAGGLEGIGMRAIADGDGVLLSGTKTQVIDGHTADVVIVVALGPDGSSDLGLYLLRSDAPGLTRTRQETLDLTRPMAILDLDGVRAAPMNVPAGAGVVTHLLDLARTLLAFEMVGGLEAVLAMAVGYAKLREQFGRPIGSFQAVKHRCADMAVELDASRAAAWYAVHAAATRSPELAIAAPLAKATAAAGFSFAAAWNLQIHGGIGFTWEHDAHLFYRRAKASELLLGSVSDHLSILGDRIGL